MVSGGADPEYNFTPQEFFQRANEVFRGIGLGLKIKEGQFWFRRPVPRLETIEGQVAELELVRDLVLLPTGNYMFMGYVETREVDVKVACLFFWGRDSYLIRGFSVEEGRLLARLKGPPGEVAKVKSEALSRFRHREPELRRRFEVILRLLRALQRKEGGPSL